MKLGELNQEEYDLAQKRIEQAHQHGVPRDAEAFEVAVVVFVNGRLQYHGGYTLAQSGGNAKSLSRELMKQAVFAVVHDIDPRGDCTLEEKES